jgi:hypothetical protein
MYSYSAKLPSPSDGTLPDPPVSPPSGGNIAVQWGADNPKIDPIRDAWWPVGSMS